VSWRDLFRRRRIARDRCVSPPFVAPAPAVAYNIVHASLRRAAEEYVDQHLGPGEKIIEATDARVINPFRPWIPGFLAKKGLALVSIPGGWRVERSRFPALAAASAECPECQASWFRCAHGVGLEFDATTKE
jgi:hypothetical protein